MALYLGITSNGTFVSSDGYTLQDSNDLVLAALPTSNKYKVILNNVVYRLNVNLNSNLNSKESE